MPIINLVASPWIRRRRRRKKKKKTKKKKQRIRKGFKFDASLLATQSFRLLCRGRFSCVCKRIAASQKIPCTGSKLACRIVLYCNYTICVILRQPRNAPVVFHVIWFFCLSRVALLHTSRNFLWGDICVTRKRRKCCIITLISQAHIDRPFFTNP